MSNFTGKGDKPRPRQITREEEELRWKYAFGGMTFDEYEAKYKKLKAKGLIKRSGRVMDG